MYIYIYIIIYTLCLTRIIMSYWPARDDLGSKAETCQSRPREGLYGTCGLKGLHALTKHEPYWLYPQSQWLRKGKLYVISHMQTYNYTTMISTWISSTLNRRSTRRSASRRWLGSPLSRALPRLAPLPKHYETQRNGSFIAWRKLTQTSMESSVTRSRSSVETCSARSSEQIWERSSLTLDVYVYVHYIF